MANVLEGKRVLVSGASIAGPSLAYWLNKYGAEVTVVERAKALRGGGYAIDLRGAAMEVAKKMGIDQALFKLDIGTRFFDFVDRKGKTLARIRPDTITGGVAGRDVEIMRGDLAKLLYGLTEHTVHYRFGDSIQSIQDRAEAKVDVTFESGVTERYDFVIGADGIHSRVRQLIFGPETQFEHYAGRIYVGFSCPNFLRLSREVKYLTTTKGQTIIQLAVGDNPKTVHAFFSCNSSSPPPMAYEDFKPAIAYFAREVADAGWVVPEMTQALESDPSPFMDRVSQIKMPCWYKGRVALVGDAAYAPSFLTGQGSSMAFVGAYVLAGELSKAKDLSEGFQNYERELRPFIKLNQDLLETGRRNISSSGLIHRFIQTFTFKFVFPIVHTFGLGKFLGRKNRIATTAIELKDYLG